MNTKHAPSPRDSAATKARILKAAKLHFAKHGYNATGTRDIAATARVGLPLVSRYFGSKAGLFEAALRDALTTVPFLHRQREGFGERLVRLICNSGAAPNPTSISTLATGDPEARMITTRVIEELVVEPLTEWLGGSNARRRAEAITMLGGGLNTHLHLLPIVNLDRPVDMCDPLLRWYADTLQRVVDCDDEWNQRRGSVSTGQG